MRVAVAFLVALVANADAGPNHVPSSVVLVIDRSGSMQGEKLEAAKDAIVAAVSALHPSDEVSVVAFDSEATAFVDRQPPNLEKLRKAIDRIQAGGGTSFLPALQRTFELLRDSKRKVKHVIFLSDGESPDDGLAELVDKMHASHITITTIGLPDNADRALLQLISEHGEGRLYMVDRADALAKIFVREIQILRATKSGQPGAVR
jgi:Mg-chelatase subunit ChlD